MLGGTAVKTSDFQWYSKADHCSRFRRHGLTASCKCYYIHWQPMIAASLHSPLQAYLLFACFEYTFSIKIDPRDFQLLEEHVHDFWFQGLPLSHASTSTIRMEARRSSSAQDSHFVHMYNFLTNRRLSAHGSINLVGVEIINFRFMHRKYECGILRSFCPFFYP
jgi:hypothetical protein